MAFNEFLKSTTFVTVNNLPKVAGLFKSAVLSYQYVSNCDYYKPLQDAKTVKEIFDIFCIKFRLENNNFYPVIKAVNPIPNIKEVLKAIAPYMAVGSLYINDDYRYYILNFDGKSISGTVRKVTDNAPTIPDNRLINDNKPINKVENKPKKAKKPTKKYSQDDVRTDLTVSARGISDNNTYTVQELAKELIRQIYLGNGNSFITATADFLFKDAEKTA